MKKVAVILALVFLPGTVNAHPGGLDGSSCHHCWTNCEEKYGIPSGSYHCHASGDRSVYTSDPQAAEPADETEPEPQSAPEPEPEPLPTPEQAPEPEPQPLPETQSEPISPEPAPPQESDSRTPEQESAPISTQTVNEDMPPEEGPEDVIPAGEEQTNDEIPVGNDGASRDVEGMADTSEGSAGDAVVGFTILAGMGYGGYRVVKGVVAKLKK